jgi:hypothetical protein
MKINPAKLIIDDYLELFINSRLKSLAQNIKSAISSIFLFSGDSSMEKNAIHLEKGSIQQTQHWH